jgi:uncharacterized membrane protein YkoI
MKLGNRIVLAAALACACGLAFAQDTSAQDPMKQAAAAGLTEPQVRAALEAKGYTSVNDVKFKNGMWKADARSADGQRVDLRIDAKTGEIYPEDEIAELSEADVRAKLAAAGYTNVHDVDFDDALWRAEADDPAGKDVEVTLDPKTGQVIGKEKD